MNWHSHGLKEYIVTTTYHFDVHAYYLIGIVLSRFLHHKFTIFPLPRLSFLEEVTMYSHTQAVKRYAPPF